MFKRYWFSALIGIYIGTVFSEINIAYFIIGSIFLYGAINFIFFEEIRKKFLLVFFCFMIIGNFLMFIRINCNSSFSGNIAGVISEVDKDGEKAVLKLKGKFNEGVILYINGIIDINEGDCIYFKGKIKKFDGKRNPGGIDYRKMYHSKNITGYIFLNEKEIADTKIERKYNRFYYYRYIVRDEIISLLKKYMKNEYQGYSIAMALGSTKHLSDESNHMIKAMGFSSVMAVSGLHIGILYFLIESILKLIGVSFSIRRFIEIVFMVIFSSISFSFYSILRAFHLIISSIFANFFDRKIDVIETTSYYSLFMIIYNPYLIYNISFLLSNMAIMGIFYFNNRIFPSIDKNKDLLKGFKVCLSINIMIVPIILYYFGEISLLGIAIYPVLSCLLEFIIIFNFITIIASFILGIKIFFIMNNFVFSFFQMILDIGNNLGFELVKFNFKNIYFIILYYFIVFTVPICNKKMLKKVFILSLTAFFAISVGLFLKNNFSNEVYIFDVGMGDSILIRSCGKNIMIDCGKEKNIDNIIRSLDFLNIGKLDYLVITHFHEDHYGGLYKLIKNERVKKIISTKNFFDNYLKLMNSKDVLINKELFLLPKDNISLVLGKSSNIFFSFPEDISKNENNNSIGAVFKVGEVQLILTGDMEREREEEFLKDISNLISGIRILKVAHHGSITSSTEYFLKKINPGISIISSGKNSYGLPDEEIINRFKNLNYKVIETEDHGCVKIYMNRKNLKIETYIH